MADDPSTSDSPASTDYIGYVPRHRESDAKTRSVLEVADYCWESWTLNSEDDLRDFDARELAHETLYRLRIYDGVRAWPNRFLRDGFMDRLEDYFTWRYRLGKLLDPDDFPEHDFMGYRYR